MVNEQHGTDAMLRVYNQIWLWIKCRKAMHRVNTTMHRLSKSNNYLQRFNPQIFKPNF